MMRVLVEIKRTQQTGEIQKHEIILGKTVGGRECGSVGASEGGGESGSGEGREGVGGQILWPSSRLLGAAFTHKIPPDLQKL